MKYTDLVTRALGKLQALSPGEVPDNDLMAAAMAEIVALFDQWAARGIMAYNVNFSLFTLAANHSPTKIGPNLVAPEFNLGANTVRPVKIVSAAWVLSTGGQAVDTPILNIRDDDWWAQNRLKSLTSTIATDLYYSPDFPNGNLYFWPIPTVANQVRLEMWGQIPQNPLSTDTFVLPPGYYDAATLSLAFRLKSILGAAAIVTPELVEEYRLAMRVVEGNNAQSPRISTAQAGMKPSRAGGRADFNWADGTIT